MPEKDNGMTEKAVLFFQRARKAADTGNFDYAIEMYIEGLRCSPDDILQGHAALRELALKRQGKGGKKPSMMEKVKHLRAKEPLEQMLNAEYLLAKDPDNLTYAEDALKAAIAGQYNQTAQWMADFLFAANNASDKPSFKTYLLLKDSYSAIGRFERALAACARAHHLKPEEEELPAEIKRLSAELTVSKGKYDQSGDFHQSIKDRESQEDMQLQSRAMKTIDYRQSALQKARQAYEKEPQIAQNVFNLAQTLAEMETDPTDLEAIKLLENRYAQTKDFSFKQRAGQIYMNQIRRKIRLTRAELETHPGNGQTKQQLNDLVAKLNSAELAHYKQCVDNYPTDATLKYEYGLRLMRNKQFDDAIPLFQHAQRDPRHRISAMDKIGLCFFLKGWHSDAADIFSQAIESYEIKDDAMAKELRYNLARAYEEQGKTDDAIEIYRKIAQLDFSYKDVRQRIDNLRKSETTSQ